MTDYAKLTIEELADLLTEKTEQYHKILATGAELSQSDRMKLFTWLKDEIKLIQWEINARSLNKTHRN